MTHSVFRTGLAIASAALAMAVTLPADAAKKASLPDIQVLGVDNVCDSFTTAVDSSGNTTTYFGLPVVGFAVVSFSNGTLTVGQPPVNVLSNYGGNFKHKNNTKIQ